MIVFSYICCRANAKQGYVDGCFGVQCRVDRRIHAVDRLVGFNGGQSSTRENNSLRTTVATVLAYLHPINVVVAFAVLLAPYLVLNLIYLIAPCGPYSCPYHWVVTQLAANGIHVTKIDME